MYLKNRYFLNYRLYRQYPLFLMNLKNPMNHLFP
jgi:hypothetical protein